MTPPPGRRGEFDAWYRERHIPARMEIEGFTQAVRGWAVQGEPAHVAIYYMTSLSVLESPAYQRLKKNPDGLTDDMLRNVAAFTRWTAEEIADTGPQDGARLLYVVTCCVPENAQSEFDRWYAEDHVPTLMQSPLWLRVRRYAPAAGGTPSDVTRIAVHELANLEAMDSRERSAARASEWRASLAANPWFSTMRYAIYDVAESFHRTIGPAA